MNHELSTMIQNTKHEIISCDRCGGSIECKANSYTKCQCSKVQLNLNEVQYISENFEGCMCAACLLELQAEYKTKILDDTKIGLKEFSGIWSKDEAEEIEKIITGSCGTIHPDDWK